jgi:hypothetical protein
MQRPGVGAIAGKQINGRWPDEGRKQAVLKPYLVNWMGRGVQQQERNESVTDEGVVDKYDAPKIPEGVDLDDNRQITELIQSYNLKVIHSSSCISKIISNFIRRVFFHFPRYFGVV